MGSFFANENSCLCTKAVPVVKHMDVEMCLSAVSENELDVTQRLIWYNMCLLSVKPMQAQLKKETTWPECAAPKHKARLLFSFSL